MAKETNYAVVQAEIERQLNEQPIPFESIVGREIAVLCILNIYMTSDLCRGFGQDFNQKISVISSPQRISVIFDGQASFYKDDTNICLYNDLSDDVGEIILVLDTAYERATTDRRD